VRPILALALAAVGYAQTPVSLADAAARRPPDFLPAREGEQVRVSGVVGAPRIRILDYTHLAIQDEAARGLILEGPSDAFADLAPGDHVEAAGIVSRRGGMPVVQVSEIRKRETGQPPAPVALSLAEVNSFRHIGVLVSVSGRVAEAGENAGGSYLEIGDGQSELKIFLPRETRRGGADLLGFRAGDRVRARGAASQYTNVRPYDRGFQLLVARAEDVTLVERPVPVSRRIGLAVGSLVALLLLGWWLRERRMSVQRRGMRSMYSLSEEIMASPSAMEILRRLLARLPKVNQASRARVYLYRPATGLLERVASPADPTPAAFPIDTTTGPIAASCALAFRNRTVLAISEMRRSPFAGGDGDDLPGAALFVPMFAQEDLLGVLEIDYDTRGRRFSADEKAAAQHLANQVATALRLIEQQSIREQLHRSEKLAAAGQLISGVAEQLRVPLEAIGRRAEELMAGQSFAACTEELAEIAEQSRKATGIIAQLLSVAQSDEARPAPVALNELIARLVETRRAQAAALGLSLRCYTPAEPLVVLGVESQLEHVFLNLLVHAERALADAIVKEVQVSSTAFAARALVEISWRSEPGEADPLAAEATPPAGALGLAVCRGILHSHGGNLAWSQDAEGITRFEVDLPRREETAPEAPATHRDGPAMTTLVVGSEPQPERRLVAMLSARGHRVVPVATIEEAVDLTRRLRFELVFCPVRPPADHWVEFFREVRHRIGALVLVTDAEDDLRRAFQGEALTLPLHFSEARFEQLMSSAESRRPGARLPA
jgi:signal transduction histidine kinase